MATEKLTIKWIMFDKNCLMFKEKKGNFLIDPKAVTNKSGLVDGASVEASIQDKTVTLLKPVGASTPAPEKAPEPVKEAPKAETPVPQAEPPAPTPAAPEAVPVVNSDVKTWTVAGFNLAKEVIKFKESTDIVWYQVPEEIRKLDWDALGIKAKAVVNVKLGTLEVNGKQKPSITDIQVVNQPEPIQEPKATTEEEKNKRKSYTAEKDESIERQCALKTAGGIVASMVEHGNEATNTPDKIKSVLRAIAEEGISFIQGK